MRRMITLLLVAALLVGFAAPAAYAGGRGHGGSSTATNVALGLASFAVFNQLVGPLLHPRPVYARPVHVYQPVYVAPPPQQVIYTQQPQVVMVQPAPPPPPAVPPPPAGPPVTQ